MSIKIDRKLIEQIGALDDKTLSGLIMEIARKTGADERKAARAASNVRTLRKKVAKMSDDELNEAVDSVGSDKVNEVLGALSEKGIIPK